MILVFGSLNLDLVFTLEELPRPGETVIASRFATLPGGKGANQAVAAARAGAKVAIAGAVGEDAFGKHLLAALAESGVDASLVRWVAAPTGCAAIAVDAKGGNHIMVASGANAEARAADVPDRLLGPATILLLERELSGEECATLAQRAKRRGSRVILNLAPAGAAPDALIAASDILVLNEGEAAAALGGSAEACATRRGLTVIVTLGAAGAVAYTPDGATLRVPALPIEPVDTTGAGDAFVGALAAALDRGLALPEALRRASVAGSLACLKTGAQSALPTAAEIDAALERLPGR